MMENLMFFIRGALGHLFFFILTFSVATSIQSISGNMSLLIAFHSWKKMKLNEKEGSI